MISISIELIGFLQKKLGKKKLQIFLDKSTTIKMLIQRLEFNVSSKTSLFTDNKDEDIRSSILILVNGKEISALNGLNTLLENDASVTFIPFSHGG